MRLKKTLRDYLREIPVVSGMTDDAADFIIDVAKYLPETKALQAGAIDISMCFNVHGAQDFATWLATSGRFSREEIFLKGFQGIVLDMAAVAKAQIRAATDRFNDDLDKAYAA